MEQDIRFLILVFILVSAYEAYRRRPFKFINDIKLDGLEEIKGWYTLHLPGTSTKNGAIFVLPKRVTNIVIDAHGNDPPFRTGARQTIESTQHLKLEGKFNDYFDVYSVEGHQLFALSILTPDVMETIMAKATKFDIELKDNMLLIGVKDSVRYKSVRDDVEQVAAALLPEIIHQLNTQDKDENELLSTRYLKTLDSDEIRFGRFKFARLHLMLAILALTLIAAIYIALFV